MGNRLILAFEYSAMSSSRKKKEQFLICHTPGSFATLSLTIFATYALHMDIFSISKTIHDKYPIQAVGTQLFSVLLIIFNLI